MKTKEELNALKEEVEELNKKLVELSEDELKQVVGGSGKDRDSYMMCHSCGYVNYDVSSYTGNGDGPYECPWCNSLNFYREDGETRRHPRY